MTHDSMSGVACAANRELAMSSGGKLTHAHMKNGIDEDGNRVRIFSSALTSERCIKVGLGKVRFLPCRPCARSPVHQSVCLRKRP